MAHHGQLNTSKIWDKAIQKYEEVTEEKLDDQSLRSLATVEELSKAVEDENEKFRAFRKRRRPIFAALAAALRPVEQVSDIAASAASTAFPPSSAVFGVVKRLIQAGKGVSDRYDTIVKLLSSLVVRTFYLFLPASLESLVYSTCRCRHPTG